MSKSKGNVVDPLTIMERYGTDAFRFTLAALAAQGRDVRLSEERIDGYRNFANKIWNAARLVLTNVEGYSLRLAKKGQPSIYDQWIQARLNVTIVAVRKALDAYRFNDAASAVYQFIWSDFCDWYLEIAKTSLYQTEDPIARAVTQRTLLETLETVLRLLHPFMPFISEEIWQRLPNAKGSIMVTPFPRAKTTRADRGVLQKGKPILDVVGGVRSGRGERKMPPGKVLEVQFASPSPAVTEVVNQAKPVMEKLARAKITVVSMPPVGWMYTATDSGGVYINPAGAIDVPAEKQRLGREIDKAKKEIAFLEGKLGRPDFVERAPAEVVARDRERLAEQGQILTKLTASLAALQ